MKSKLTVTNMCNYVVSVYFCVFSVLCASCLLYEGDVCVSKSDGRQGQCVDVRRCRSALDEIKLKKHPQLCSFNRSHPIICCTDSELVDVTSTTLVSVNKPGQKARDNCLKYLTGPHYGCTLIRNRTEISPPSQPAHPRVRDALSNEFPHMALLGHGLEWNSAEWLCGGSVISDRFVLTSAHCARNHEGTVKFVALGVLKRTEIPLTRKEQRYEVKNIIYHPYYEYLVKYFDIALLEVSPSIQFNSISIKPACLALDSSADTANALSWGSLGHSQSLVNTLQVMNFNKFSTEVCDDAYPSYRNFPEGFDSETQDCFGDKNNISYTCSIDSGGPLQVRLQIAKDSTSKPCGVEIISLISFGSPCPRGPFSSAGVFTKIPYYVPWIEDIVWP